MARITTSLIVQRVDDLIVVMDDSTGAEVAFPVTSVPAVIMAMQAQPNTAMQPVKIVADRTGEEVSIPFAAISNTIEMLRYLTREPSDWAQAEGDHS